jgi:hypothetical protein
MRRAGFHREILTMATRSIQALVGVALAAVAFTVAAQTKAPPPKGPPLDQLDCRTLLRLDGDERAYTLLYYHGFVSGRQNLLLLPAEQLAEATDRIIDRCIDRPNDKVLAVFEQVRAGK